MNDTNEDPNDAYFSFRSPKWMKNRVNNLPIGNSEYLRDLVERDLTRRELAKKEKEKEAPVRIEQAKELVQEIQSLEKGIAKDEEVIKDRRESKRTKVEEKRVKQGELQAIKESLMDDKDMDKITVDGLIGDL